MRNRFSTAIVVALCCALATQAPAKSYYEGVVEAACNDIRAARTPQDLATVGKSHADRVAADLQSKRNFAKDDFTKLVRDLFMDANKARVAADVELGNLTGFAAPTTADLQQTVVVAQQGVAAVEQIVEQRKKLQDDLDVLLLATVKTPDWKTQADNYRKQIADRQKDIDTKMPPAQNQLAAAKAAHKKRLDRIAELRRDLPKLNDDEAFYLNQLNQAVRDQATAAGEVPVLEDVQKRIADCVEAQRRALNPGPQDDAFKTRLADIEKLIAASERRAPAVTRACRDVEEQLNATRATVARLQGQAAAIITQATAQQVRAAAAATQAAAAGKQTLTDISAAAAAVVQSRARVTQLSQAACQSARAYQGDPKGANAPGQLAEAFRNRALAEHEVVITAGALQRIRAAHAAALANAAPPAAGALDLDSGRQQLAPIRKSLFDLLDTPESLHARRRGGQFHFYVVLGVVSQLDAFTKADPRSPIGLFAIAHAPEIKALAERNAKLLPDCATPLGARINALDKEIDAALEKANEATRAIWALAPPPGLTNNVHLIEAIYDHARGIADGTAVDALNAIRCVAETQTALITTTTTPPPKTTAGIKCRYTRPGGQVIEVELFDVTTCPPEIPGRFVGSGPATQTELEKDFGEKSHDFTGTWVDNHDQFWTFTITNGRASRFPISAQSVHRGSDNQLSKWTGTCIRTEENKAVCEGKGTYENSLRTMSYTVKITMYVHVDVRRLAYDGTYTSAQLVGMKIAGMPPTPGGVSAGWRVKQSLQKQ